MNLRRGFLLAFAGTLAVKAFLAWVVPLSGDEAYYYVYGIHPAMGYKDHPPMVGWMLHLVLYLGRSELLLRLPAILFSSLAGLAIYLLLARFDEEKACVIAVLYLLSPLNLFNVLVTTDTPLYLFVLRSGVSLFLALDGDRPWQYALSGAFLGCAFLSKYLAALLGIAYVVYAILSRKEAGRRKGFALLFLSALPFAIVNLAWNYDHCWDNIVFNVVNRNRDIAFTPKGILWNILAQAYLATPPILYALYTSRKGMAGRVKAHELSLFAFLFLVPLACFTVLSTVRMIGLHWSISFYPFLYLALFPALGDRSGRRLLTPMATFSAAHLALLAVLLLVPIRSWQGQNFYRDIVFMFRAKDIAAQLQRFGPQFRFATMSYAQSATLEYHSGKEFCVFGVGSHNGRQDDIITDFRTLDGRDLLVFRLAGDPLPACAPYFRSVTPGSVVAAGETFRVAVCRGFDYDKYRDKVLKEIADSYFHNPSFLPHGKCYFRERYFDSSGTGGPNGRAELGLTPAKGLE